MPTQTACPKCATAWDEADVSCPACGFVNPPLDAPEELVASWMAPFALPSAPLPAREVVCVVCGYQGPPAPSPDGDGRGCPACGDDGHDRPAIVRRMDCPDCGHRLLLTVEDRGKMILCPGCHSLLGCLLERRGGRRGLPPVSLDLVAVCVATVLGYLASMALWPQRIGGDVMITPSMMALSTAWSLTAVRTLGPRRSRRPRFDPPGLAACLAVSAASLLNALRAIDAGFVSRPGPDGVFARVALPMIEPLPLSAAVLGVWVFLIVNRRWRTEPTWHDRLARLLGAYWLSAGFLGLIFRVVR